MARGPSGRIVIEVEPDLKQALYEALAQDGVSLKQWFVGRAEHFIEERYQMRLELESGSKTSA